MELTERFMAKVEKTDGCWYWTASLWPGGYGQFKDKAKGSRHTVAHRWSYEFFVGPIPEGMTIDHTCHNVDPACQGGRTCLHRRCVNPAHLEAVTERVNLLRGKSPWADNARKTHCPQGHPYDEENTIPLAPGRRCRICAQANSAAQWRIRKTVKTLGA
jgi:hypothetical protein